MEFLYKIKKDNIFIGILLLIIILGVFLRLNGFSEVGYWGDDEATIPAGLMWFYPHSYFPGLNYGNPPLGDMIIGAGCMLSGEDFSGVSNIQPFFYPDRYYLIGEALSNSNTECHLPMYLFGILFFILIIYFALTFFNKYSALFLISFFAFSPEILKYSGWIKTDIILWTFTLISFIFFLKGYQQLKHSVIEAIHFLISFFTIGLAFASKFSIAFMAIIYFSLIIKKYSNETLQILSIISKKLSLTFLRDKEVDKKNCITFIKLLLVSGIIYIFSILMFFKLNPKNFLDTYTIYQKFNQNLASNSLKFNNLIEFFKNLLLKLNLLDTLFFLFAFYLYYKLIKKENKGPLDNFILFLAPIGFILSIIFPVFVVPYRSLPYLFGFIFLMSLSFSKISPLWKIKNRKLVFALFILIYISFSFYNAYSVSPYFENANPIICSLKPESCNFLNIGYSTKQTADYLKSVLKDDETFIGTEGTIFFYLRHSQGILDWNFHQAFQQQIGREPTLSEKIKYFKPENQTVRYLLFAPIPRERFGEEATQFKETYEPNHIVKINKEDAMWIYDLQNLHPK
ncbi:MAG: glycosyltransferase family 39 protein [Nanoarchaeota archaeon]|nr:glycosyltransferase family 39 protein [Nanoarchaeota archaeon]